MSLVLQIQVADLDGAFNDSNTATWKAYLHHPLVLPPQAEVEVMVFEVLMGEQTPTSSFVKPKLEVASAGLPS